MKSTIPLLGKHYKQRGYHENFYKDYRGGYHGVFSRKIVSSFTFNQLKRLALDRRFEGLIKTRKNLIKPSHIGFGENGSIINPGVLYFNDKFILLCRGEPTDIIWLGNFLMNQAIPYWCVFDSDLNYLKSIPFTSEKIPPYSRSEDWRLFSYKGKVYSNHSLYMRLNDNRDTVRSRLGISSVNVEYNSLELCWVLEPPFKSTAEEKNWCFFCSQ